MEDSKQRKRSFFSESGEKALISGGGKCSFGDDGAEEGSSVSRVWTQQAIMPLKIKYS